MKFNRRWCYPISTKGFITWSEWSHMRWSSFKWHVCSMFGNRSTFKGWDIDKPVELKAKKKYKLIANNTIREGGTIILK